MDRDKIIEKINARTNDGKISCEQALEVATETGTPTKELGDLLDELKIKIISCRLGCFP